MDNSFSESIRKLVEKYPEQRMRTSLSQVFIDFLRYQEQQGTMPTNSYTLLNDMEAMFVLLEIIDSHGKNEHNS